LVSGAGVDAVHTLDEAGLLDGFFVFLQETKVLAHWQSFQLEAVQRVFLPAIFFVLLYGGAELSQRLRHLGMDYRPTQLTLSQ
jgi:hypothetical protein